MGMYPLDGRRDGKFYVDGLDESHAPEFATLGRRRWIGLAVAAVALLLAGLVTHTGAWLLVGFILQAGVVVFALTEHATVRAIRERRAHPTTQE